MATQGLIPFCAIYSTFLQRAYDQIIHDVCIESLPVVFALDRGGIVGEDGATHHGLFDLSYLRSMPNMVVMAPKDENELQRMLMTAIRHPGPTALRYPRGAGMGVHLDTPISPIDVGKAEIVCESQAPDDILIVAIGRTVEEALIARRMLKNEHNRTATVINARFVKPLDIDLIGAYAARIPYLLTVEENTLQGGFGSAVLEALIDAGISGFKMKRLGIDDVFVEHGPQKLLRRLYGVDADAIVAAALDLLPQSH